MALTVEELQIVLSCDATTAQTVLAQMDATVKAYTTKFQKYFQNMGGKQDGKVPGLDNVVKNVEKQAKRLEKAGADWKKRYQETFGETFDSSMMKAKIRSAAMGNGEYKPSGRPILPPEGSGGVYDPNYFQNSEAYKATFSGRTPNKEIDNLASKVHATLKESLGSVNSISDAMRSKIGDALKKLRQMSREYKSAVSEHGSGSEQANKSLERFKKAIYAADQYIQKLDKVAAKEQKANAATSVSEPSNRMQEFAKRIVSVRNRVQSLGKSLKKSFDHTFLGRFFHQLGRIMVRMAAMRLINGVINGAKQGLEAVAKSSASSARAMNTVKAAGNSIKMSLGAAVMPIVKALAPLFVTLAKAIAAAGNALARFFAVVTGQSTYTAVNFSESLGDISSSAGGAGKAVKGMLADFDELIVIGNKSGGGGGGGGGIGESLSTVGTDLPAISDLGQRIREAIERGDWRGVGEALATKFNEALGNWDSAATGKKLSEIVKAIIDVGLGLIETTDWALLGEKLYTFIASIDYEGIAERLSEGIGAALGGLGEFLLGVLKGAFTKACTDLHDSIFENGEFSMSGFLEGISSFLERLDPVKWVYNHVYVPFLSGLLKSFGISSSEPAKEMVGPGESVSHGILEGIAAPFKTIGTWLQEHIVDPVKNWFKDHSINIPSLIATTDFDFQLPDMKEFSSIWKGLKSGKKTFTAKLAGVKEKVITTLATSWDKIKDKTASLTASITEGIETRMASVKEAWSGIKAGTKKLTAKLAGTAASTFTTIKNAWGTISTKDSTLTATLKKDFTDAALSTLKTAWTSIGNVTAKFTAVVNASDVVKKFITGWNNLKDKSLYLEATLKEKVKEAWNKVAKAWNATPLLKALGTLPTFAKGGVVYGPTLGLIGEYSGAQNNPEVIAPLSDLVGLLTRANAPVGGAGGSSDQIRLLEEQNALLRQIARKELAISPSAQLGQVVERSRQLYART